MAGKSPQNTLVMPGSTGNTWYYHHYKVIPGITGTTSTICRCRYQNLKVLIMVDGGLTKVAQGRKIKQKALSKLIVKSKRGIL